LTRSCVRARQIRPRPCRDDQIAFIFAILIIDEDEHASVACFLDNLLDRRKRVSTGGGHGFDNIHFIMPTQYIMLHIVLHLTRVPHRSIVAMIASPDVSSDGILFSHFVSSVHYLSCLEIFKCASDGRRADVGNSR
jgi:hypothetical protein